MKNKLFIISILSMLLAFNGCNNGINNNQNKDEQTPSESQDDDKPEDIIPSEDDPDDDDDVPQKNLLDYFYEDIEGKNFTVSSKAKKELFCGEYGYSEEILNGDEFAILPITNKGIFEAHKLENGDYEIHGMLSPNKNIPYNLFSYNFMAMTDIKKTEWKYIQSTDRFQMFANNRTFDSLVNAGMFENVEYVETIYLKEGINSKYELTVKYFSESMIDDEKINITNVGTTENLKMKELGKTEPVVQTEWNDYQIRGMTEYGFADIPFFSTFSLGLKLYFNYFAINGTGVTVFEIYDYLGKKQDEEVIADELVNLYGFELYAHQDEGVYSYYKSYLDEINLLITFKYVPVDEILPATDRVAFPYGYTQIAFAYVAAEKDLNKEELDTFLEDAHLPAVDVDMDKIARIYKIEYRDIYNKNVMEDPNYISACEALEEEVGPMYEEYFSLFFELKDKDADYDYIVDLLDTFRKDLKENGFVIRPECEADDIYSIDAAPNGTISYDLYEEDNLVGGLDIYLNGIADDFEAFNGTVEIVYELYTELGLNVLNS